MSLKLDIKQHVYERKIEGKLPNGKEYEFIIKYTSIQAKKILSLIEGIDVSKIDEVKKLIKNGFAKEVLFNIHDNFVELLSEIENIDVEYYTLELAQMVYVDFFTQEAKKAREQISQADFAPLMRTMNRN